MAVNQSRKGENVALEVPELSTGGPLLCDLFFWIPSSGREEKIDPRSSFSFDRRWPTSDLRIVAARTFWCNALCPSHKHSGNNKGGLQAPTAAAALDWRGQQLRQAPAGLLREPPAGTRWHQDSFPHGDFGLTKNRWRRGWDFSGIQGLNVMVLKLDANDQIDWVYEPGGVYGLSAFWGWLGLD